MKKKTKSKIKKVIKKTFKILIVLFVILTIYSFGRIRGMIDGIYLVQLKNNDTVCNFMNKTRDTDGFCLIVEGEHKYRYYLDCGWEKFKIEGERKPPFLAEVLEWLRRIIYYPALGC